ncbi:MAG: hypothetical protein M9891_04345 [Austwickia sp.]|nr:hypothetical protein [Actinomycetota bacterium]MCB1251745.1 hypothetical protein [Austwickia sp.]MCO5308514.1 hypothetical protein [Austwickia sp.]
MTRYEALARRVGNSWAIQVANVGPTQARRLGEIEEMARDLVACMANVDVHTVDIDITVELPEGVRHSLEHAHRARAAEEQSRAEANRSFQDAARQLRDGGLTVREIGTLLGVSYQRAHQLLSA